LCCGPAKWDWPLLESLTPEERELIDNMARLDGKTADQFAVWEINLMIDQAKGRVG
jgi:hypothetical protein